MNTLIAILKEMAFAVTVVVLALVMMIVFCPVIYFVQSLIQPFIERYL